MDKFKYSIILYVLLFCSCGTKDVIKIHALPDRSSKALTGSEFFEKIKSIDSETREILIEHEILNGNFPDFLRQFVRINASITTKNGKKISAYYLVMPDYLMIGNNTDFFRIPMQPKTAQKIADRFNCFLPTRKICDDIYNAAVVKLEPYPLTENRDSLETFFYHNQIIEKQRNGREGLIAGIKKDVIITTALNRDKRPHRLALYGWHKPDRKPIQPIYTGHVDWYVDYSHGIRLIYRTIYVDGVEMDYIDVLKNSDLSPLICDEESCDYFSYPYVNAGGV